MDLTSMSAMMKIAKDVIATTKKVLKKNAHEESIESIPNKTIEDYLNQGAQKVQSVLQNQVDYLVDSVQANHALRNIDVISSNIANNREVPKKIKKTVAVYSNQLREAIKAAAYHIERKRFESIDQVLSDLDLSMFDRNRLNSLLSAQKNISFSFQSLSLVIEYFSKCNDGIVKQITSSQSSVTNRDRIEKTKLYLKNAILVFEITNFALEYINNFRLNGIDDLMYIKQEVLREIEEAELKDTDLRKDLVDEANTGSEATKASTLTYIEHRTESRQRVKELWHEMEQKLQPLHDGVGSAKKLLVDLDIIRRNAMNQIDTLNIVAITQIAQTSLEAVEGIGNLIKSLKLAPLTSDVALDLLNISKPIQLPSSEKEDSRNTGSVT